MGDYMFIRVHDADLPRLKIKRGKNKGKMRCPNCSQPMRSKSIKCDNPGCRYSVAWGCDPAKDPCPQCNA